MSLPDVSPPNNNLIVLTDSDSDSESDVASWVRTPDGSPPSRRTSRRHILPSGSGLPNDPPPAYSEYLQPTLASFGFHPNVAEFLASRNISSAGLSRIDSTLNFHLDDWNAGFAEAGLSEQDAQALHMVVIESLPVLSRDALLTAWTVPG